MSKPRRTLKQIAIDMRAAGVLIEGAAEIEAAGTLLESVNLSALSTLLGGGPVEAAPFHRPSPNGGTPGERSPRKKPVTEHRPKLTREQKAAIREKWNRLPEAARTDTIKEQLAGHYKVPLRVISLILGTDLEAAKQRMLAARARIGHSRSDQTRQTRTSVN
jgi:hypothetical protein